MSHPLLKCCCLPTGFCACSGATTSAGTPASLSVTLANLNVSECFDNNLLRKPGSVTTSLKYGGASSFTSGTWDVPRVAAVGNQIGQPVGSSYCVWRLVLGTVSRTDYSSSTDCTTGGGSALTINVILEIARSYLRAASGQFHQHETVGQRWGAAIWIPHGSTLGQVALFGGCRESSDSVYDNTTYASKLGGCCDVVQINNGYTTAAGECVFGSEVDGTVHNDFNIGWGGTITITPDCP